MVPKASDATTTPSDQAILSAAQTCQLHCKATANDRVPAGQMTHREQIDTTRSKLQGILE